MNTTRRVSELTLHPTREVIIHEPHELNGKILFVSNHEFPQGLKPAPIMKHLLHC